MKPKREKNEMLIFIIKIYVIKNIIIIMNGV